MAGHTNKAAPANCDHVDVCIGNVLKHFERDRPLAGHHLRILERMEIDASVALGLRLCSRVRIVLSFPNDTRSRVPL